jgi:hypothetical protein
MGQTPIYSLPYPASTDPANIPLDMQELATAVENNVGGAAVPKSVVDAAGDLIVGSGADAVSRLAKGTDGQVLKVVSGAPAWAAEAAGGIPATIVDAAGDLIVASAADTVQRLAKGTDGQVLTAQAAAPGVGWATPAAAGGAPSYGTTPPTAVDGAEWIYPVGNGVLWRFRYNAGSASAYKWEFVGGSGLAHDVATGEGSSTAATWLNLATNGPLVTIPRAGEYRVAFGAITTNTQVTANNTGVAVGDTTPFASVLVSIPGVNYQVPVSSEVPRTFAANDILKLRYYFAAGTGTWSSRWLRVIPVRVS